MPTFTVKGKEYSVVPWNDWLDAIQLLPDPPKVFARVQKNTSGVIIVRWSEEPTAIIAGPEHYFTGKTRFHKDEPEYFKKQSFFWERFNDEVGVENPLQYKRLKKAVDMVGELREIFKTERIGLVFWRHSEYLLRPLERYEIMKEGNQYPGSPRQ